MKRVTGLFFWALVVLVAGTANFVVKHTVQRLDDELGSARRKTVAEQKQIHELTAEWTYLNQPELLSTLNRRYVGLVPVAPKQLQRNVDDIPLRPVAPPPASDIPLEPETEAVAVPAAAPATNPIVPAAATNVAGVAPAPAAAPASPVVPVAAPAVARVASVPASAPANPIVPVAATSVARVSPPPAAAAPISNPGRRLRSTRCSRKSRETAEMLSAQRLDDNPCRPRHFRPPPCAPVVANAAAFEYLDATRTRLLMAISLFVLIFLVIGGRLVEVVEMGGTAEPRTARASLSCRRRGCAPTSSTATARCSRPTSTARRCM